MLEAVVDDLVGDLLVGGEILEVRLHVDRDVGMVGHDQGNVEGLCGSDGGEHETSGCSDVDDIGFEPLTDPLGGPIEIEAQGYGAVPRERESVVIEDGEAEEVVGWLVALVGGEDLDVVARLAKELEHLLEPVGVSADVVERRGFDEQSNLQGRRLLERDEPDDGSRGDQEEKWRAEHRRE